MTALTVWLTDDCCPLCGTPLRERTGADGPVTQGCGCGWSATWQADQDGGER